MRLRVALAGAMLAVGIVADVARAEWVEPFDRASAAETIWMATGEALMAVQPRTPTVNHLITSHRQASPRLKDFGLDFAIEFCIDYGNDIYPLAAENSLKEAMSASPKYAENHRVMRKATWVAAQKVMCPRD